MTNDKWQTAEGGKALLHKIGMVGWLYYFVENSDPEDHKAISDPESALLDPQSRNLSPVGKLPFFLSWLSPHSSGSPGGNSCPS